MASHRTAVALALLAGTVLAPGRLLGQDKSTYYTVTHPGEFTIDWKGFYDHAERLTAAARKDLPHELDIAYGSDPKQRLDVYRPVSKPSGAPVFVFLHGGGFREGDKAQYGYVSAPLARHGIVTVVASYRLMPQAHYPDQPDDVKRALAWVHANIARYGGNPDAIYLGGHSAGAILTADVGLRGDWQAGRSLPAALIKGCVPISAPYDLRNEKGVTDYIQDPARRAEASPLLNVRRPPARTVVAVGSVEPYVDASKALVEAIVKAGGKAELLVLDGLPHDKTVAALADERSPLVKAILDMIQGRSH